jgi:ribosomal-protein-alanine N-acetyltransferase
VPFSTALTDDVTLRLVQGEDGVRLARAQVKNQRHLAPWNPTRDADFFTEGWQQANVSQRLSAYEAGTGLPLVLVSAGEIVGRVTLFAITRGAFQSAVLSYWIDVDFCGHGLMTSAVQTIVTFARQELNLHRLQAETLPINHSSQGVLRKAGFQQIGHAPAYLKICGVWQAHDLYQKILQG